MGFLNDLTKGIKNYNDKMMNDINKWYDRYQYKSDDELKNIVRCDNDKIKKMAAIKILRERGY